MIEWKLSQNSMRHCSEKGDGQTNKEMQSVHRVAWRSCERFKPGRIIMILPYILMNASGYVSVMIFDLLSFRVGISTTAILFNTICIIFLVLW